MERSEALQRLSKLVGTDLRKLAYESGITVWTPSVAPGHHPPPSAKLNKGWAGQAIERYLGLPLNSSRAPNFGSWELKLVPLKRTSTGGLRVKETMAITMIDPVEVEAKSFEDSHLYTKLRKTIVASRIVEDRAESRSALHSVGTFDLNDAKILELVRADYNSVRSVIKREGFEGLTGAMGVLVQPRTKGAGHGTTSRAFYARTQFVSHILGIERLVLG